MTHPHGTWQGRKTFLRQPQRSQILFWHSLVFGLHWDGITSLDGSLALLEQLCSSCNYTYTSPLGSECPTNTIVRARRARGRLSTAAIFTAARPHIPEARRGGKARSRAVRIGFLCRAREISSRFVHRLCLQRAAWLSRGPQNLERKTAHFPFSTTSGPPQSANQELTNRRYRCRLCC
jgi:hypothetical protein